MSMINRFLPPNPAEPPDVYQTRVQEASYRSYLGPIVDYFCSWLFSGAFSVRAKDQNGQALNSVDSYYSEFQEDVGGDVDIVDFMRERMTKALVKGCSYWLLSMPDDGGQPATDKFDYERRRLGYATLQAVEREELYDWEVDEHNKLIWCVLHKEASIRQGLGAKRNIVRETWRYFDREKVETYQIEYERKKRPGKTTDIPLVDSRPHGFQEVPLVCLHIKDGMWVGERVRSPQIEHFRLQCANNWLIRRTAYAMPVLKLEDQNSVPVMGAGYYVAIGKDEEFQWSSPSNTPFDVISKEIQNQRDEIYRIVHQMAQGLSNNAETTGRSAESKDMDVAATRIMLNAYGSIVRKAIEETLEIISDARGDTNIFWSVEGLNGFDTTTTGSLIDTAASAQLLGIPSQTFKREIKQKIALALIPEADQNVKQKIKSEIADAIDKMSAEDDMPADLVAELEKQAQKDKTAIEIQKLKSETQLEIQSSKDRNVLLELEMASRGQIPAGEQAKIEAESKAKPRGGPPPSPQQAKPAPGQPKPLSKAARNLIKSDL